MRAARDAGFNLVRCRGVADLNRARRAGLSGWVRLPLESGANDRLAATIRELRDHPALAVWEGPDEAVWHWTADWTSLLRKGVFREGGDWWHQAPHAVSYSEVQAGEQLPRIESGIQTLRRMDPRQRPLWFNEAARSDLKFVRGYVDSIDVTGCDYYPVTAFRGRMAELGEDLDPPLPDSPSIAEVGDYTERFRRIGRDRPVWMVLQGFSWDRIEGFPVKTPAYPTFAESRTMAYDAIVHQARGLFYWGTAYIPPERADFRDSLYALVAELASLQPFLVVPDVPGVEVELIDSRGRGLQQDRGVRVIARQSGGEYAVVLVNEDKRPHMGVCVRGLQALEGRGLELLYGAERTRVKRGEWVTRLMPLETKVFATSRKYESPAMKGRDFQSPTGKETKQ